jgi:hypothetical protein
MEKRKVKKLVYGEHADAKFELLRKHGVEISRRQVNDAVRRPEKVEDGYKGRKVAQREISDTHVLRVVYEEGPHEVRIVTFYPGRKDRYARKL